MPQAKKRYTIGQRILRLLAAFAVVVVAAGIIETAVYAHFLWKSQAYESTMRSKRAMVDVRDCLDKFRATQPDRGFPERLSDLEESGVECLSESPWVMLSEGRFNVPGTKHWLEYQPGPREGGGAILTYRIDVRPEVRRFGWHKLDNLMTDETGVIHVTKEDRPATKDDPPI